MWQLARYTSPIPPPPSFSTMRYRDMALRIMVSVLPCGGDAAAVRSDGGADRWAAASDGIAQAAAAPKKSIPISPRKGEVSEKAGSGSRDDGLSGPGEDRLEPPEKRTVLEGLSWR